MKISERARAGAPGGLEPLEPRLLLSGDLSVAIGPGVPAMWLPGDRVEVPVIVTNNGPGEAVGELDVELWTSNDQTIGGDRFVDAADDSGRLAPGESATHKFRLTVPLDAQPGPYYLLAKIFPGAGVGDANPANDTAFSAGASEVVWKFGTFTDGAKQRKNFKLKVYGQDQGAGDVLVTFGLSGGGHGEIFGGDVFGDVIVHDTTAKSSLSIQTAGRLATSVGNLTVFGPLKSLTAKTTGVRGHLWVEHAVGKLVLDDVDADHEIILNGSGAPVDARLSCSITLDRVRQSVLETNGLPIRSLTVTEWLDDGDVRAPSLGKLTAKGDRRRGLAGHFESNLWLDGAGGPKLTLGGAKIAGQLNDVAWNVTGDVGAVRVGQGVYWSNIEVHSSLKSFQAGDFADSAVEVDGPVGTFSVAGWDDSDLLADSLKKLTAGSFHRGRLNLLGLGVPEGKTTLGSAKVGDITDSAADPDGRGWNVHGDAGKVTAGDVDEWSFRLHSSLKSIKLGMAWDTQIEVDDVIGSVQASEWFGGVLQAAAVKSVKIAGDRREGIRGDFEFADLILTGQGVDPGKAALGLLSIAGVADDLVVEVMGNVGKVSAGAFVYSDLLLGCTELTGDASDFDDGFGGTRQFHLQSLTLKGLRGAPGDPLVYFQDSAVGAWRIGSVKFAKVPEQANGEIQCHELGRLRNEPDQLALPPNPDPDLLAVVLV